MKGKKKVRAYKKRDYQAFIYLAPWLIGLIVLQMYPFLSSLYYSFTDYQITSKPVWAGLKNYITLFTGDKEFITAFWVTIRFTIMTVPGKLLLALAVAVFLNRNIKGINMIRTLYYIPSLFGGSIAVAMLWKVMFMDNGIINSLLGLLGISGISWLGYPKVALKTICMLEIWQFGSSMVMFLAALKQVPKELYEAASIDGAGKWTQFFKITVPLITPVIFYNLITQLCQAFQEFNGPFLVTKGGPNGATTLISVLIYNNAFLRHKMGMASAQAWVLFIIVCALTGIAFVSQKKWVYYSDEDGR